MPTNPISSMATTRQSCAWYLPGMRFSVALVAMATAAFASADRLIYIPTARKIPFGEVKLEYRAEPRVQGEVERYIGAGVTTSFELELHDVQSKGVNPIGSVDRKYPRDMGSQDGGKRPGAAPEVSDHP